MTGESLDDVMPAFRVHDEKRGGRLRYVAGRFENTPVTIPELVVGVLRGALRIDAIVRSETRELGGVVLEGPSEKSFLRAGMKAFFDIKEDKNNEQALRDMAKLLANSAYGKLIGIKKNEFFVDVPFFMKAFVNKEKVCGGIAKVYAAGIGGDGLTRLLGESSGVYWGGKRQAPLAKELFQRCYDREAGPAQAVATYLEALGEAGVPCHPGKEVRVRDYVRGFKRYQCGHFFMPLASQVTGATSAMVGLMAHCTGALQGDTDSVHVVLPEGTDRIYQLPGVDRYFELMKQAGYPSPRMVKGPDGKAVCEGGIPGLGKLGIWEEECPEPSTESILVRPKLYSHAFRDKDEKSAKRVADGHVVFETKYKQAKHGFAKFDHPDVAAAAGQKGTREDRAAVAARTRLAKLHLAMGQLLGTGVYSYDSRMSPRKLKEAIASGTEVGEFCSRPMLMNLTSDPNTWRDRAGKCGGSRAIGSRSSTNAGQKTSATRKSCGKSRRGRDP